MQVLIFADISSNVSLYNYNNSKGSQGEKENPSEDVWLLTNKSRGGLKFWEKERGRQESSVLLALGMYHGGRNLAGKKAMVVSSMAGG